MASVVQIGVFCKDESLLTSLKRGSLRAGETEISFAGPTELAEAPQFSAERYHRALQTKTLGQTLLATSSIPSTQTLLHQHFSKLPDGVICVADTQTSGKGRSSNTWESPMGCLMFSAYKRLSISGQHLPFVQYIVSLAIVNAIQTVCKPLVREGALDVRIKWPNDIYANKLKIGGILCQSVYREGAFHIIMGVGLNVNNAEPTTCLANLVQSLNSQAQTERKEIRREDLLASIADDLEDLLNRLKEQGFGPLKQQYLASWLHTGQNVILEEQGASGLHKVPLTITGISETGYLTATDASKETYELHPDGNSLDFFAGLMRHKAVQLHG